MRRFLSFLLALAMTVSLAACGEKEAPPPEVPAAPADDCVPPAISSAELPPEPEPEPEPYEILDPTVPREGYVAYEGVVEHLFFHPIVAYPELAFDGDYKSDGIDDWMVTVGEYVKILESLYEKGYILVDIMDCWSETTNENGETRMVKNYLPEGKKPLILSYDDVNYYEYMLTNGFTHKLILGEDGKLWSYGLDGAGNEVISRDLDAVTVLDKFVEDHPDFSPFGAKGCLSLTGYEGILGYRTQTMAEDQSPEREAFRQSEIEAVKPIVAELKRTGWTFGSHTWGHISLNTRTYETVTADMEKWFNEVGSLVGDTSVLFYPFGGRLDGDDVKQSGPAFTWMQSQGFRIFCSVGIDSWSKCKGDISAVICDRLHPDGTTLRSSKGRERYMRFYDAADIIDLEARPEREVGWLTA